MPIRSRTSVRALIAGGLLLAGCGSEKLPSTDAEAMLRDLDKVEQGVRAGECQATQPTLRRLDRNVAALPEDVDPAARTTLNGGVAHLAHLVGEQCKQKEPDPVVTEPEPLTPPPVESTPEPAPTVTEPPPETDRQQEPKDEEPTNEDRTNEKPKESKEPKEPKGDGRDPCPPGSSAVC